MKPAPKKLALLMSAMGVGLLLPDHALAHSNLHARPATASALGLGTGAVPTCHALGVGTLAACQLANREVLLHASVTAASVQAPWPAATDKAPHLIEARWTQWSVSTRSEPSAPRQETPDAPPPASMPGEARRLVTQVLLTAAPPTLGKPNDVAARPDAKGIEHTSAGADRDREANAIAMVLMADPPSQARTPTSVSAMELTAAVAPAAAGAPRVAVAPVAALAPPAVALVPGIAELPPAAAVTAATSLASVETAETAGLATPLVPVPGSTPQFVRASVSSDLGPQSQEHTSETLALATATTLAAAPPSFGRPNDAAERPDPKATEQTNESQDRDREANAIAMVLMVNPPSQVRVPAPVAAMAAIEPAAAVGSVVAVTPVAALAPMPAVASAAAAPVAAVARATATAPVASVVSMAAAESPAKVETVRGTVAHGAATISFAPSSPGASSATTIEAAVRAMEASVPLPSQRPEQPAPSRATSEAVAGRTEAGQRLVATLKDIAPRAEPPIALKPAPVDQRSSAVDESASSPPKPPASAWQARTAAVATPNRSPASIAPAPPPVLEPPVAAVPIDAASRADKTRKQLSARQEIVVASHSDKVLMSLASLRSDEGPEAGKFGAQTKETVVVRHTDKVLLNLASIRAQKVSKEVRCKAPPAADLQRDPLPSAPPNTVECPTPEPGAAASAVAGHNLIGGDAVALSGDKLDEVRGGFVTDAGLQVSFGIERAIYLNGNLVTTTSLNVTELGKVSTGQVQLGTPSAGGVTLIQSGAGNTFLPGTISPSAVGTVIQNTLDNQKIQTITRIDAAVTAAGAVRALNLQSSLRGAITNSLRR